MFACLFLSLPYLVKAIKRSDIVFLAIVAGIFMLHVFIYPSNSQNLLSICGSFFALVFPMYFIGLRFDVNEHLRLIYVMSIINIWAFAIYTFISGDSATVGQSGYASFMNRAYILLTQLLIVIGFLFTKFNALNITTSIIGFVFLLMCGNRGSVLILLLFILIYILLITDKKRRIALCAGMLAVSVAIVYYFQILVGALMGLFMHLGMSIRVFERLLEGTFLYSQGRDIIGDTLWSAIMKNPVFGYGLASDRVIAGSYAHNYAVELWVSFGLFIGSVILIATSYLIIRAWLVTKEKSSKIFLLALICIGFLKLFISSSFLQEGMFFMLLGVCVTLLRQNKFNNISLRGVGHESL